MSSKLSLEEKTRILSWWFEGLWNRNDPVDSVMSFIDEGWREEAAANVAGQELQGREQVKGVVQLFRGHFEDIQTELSDFHDGPADDEVTAQLVMRFKQISTGKAVTLEGHVVGKVVDGGIAGGRNHLDFADLMVQMGALPPDAMVRALQGERFVVAGSTQDE